MLPNTVSENTHPDITGSPYTAINPKESVSAFAARRLPYFFTHMTGGRIIYETSAQQKMALLCDSRRGRGCGHSGIYAVEQPRKSRRVHDRKSRKGRHPKHRQRHRNAS